MDRVLAVSESPPDQGVAVVQLAGYLHGGNGTIDAAIRELAARGCTTAVLDLGSVHPVSCQGVRWLLSSIDSWRRQGVRLVLCAMRPSCACSSAA